MRILLPVLPKPAWQKSCYWAGIVLLHLLMLFCLRQTRMHTNDQHDARVYLDVSILSPQPQPALVAASDRTSRQAPGAVQRVQEKTVRTTPISPTVTVHAPETQSAPTPEPVSGSTASLDLDALRRSAVTDDKQHRHTDTLPAAGQQGSDLKLEETFGKNVAKAKRKNCENAYAEEAQIGNVTLTGLFAAGVILADTVRGKGCKW